MANLINPPTGPVQTIIARMGGSAAVADALGFDRRRVRNWYDRRSIPFEHLQAVLDLGRAVGITPADFFERP